MLTLLTWLLCGGTFVLGCWWAGRNRPTVDEAMQLHEELALQTALRGMAETSNARLREELERLRTKDRLRGEAARRMETSTTTP